MHDVVVRILLHDVHGVEPFSPGSKLLNEPGAVIGSVSKNLAVTPVRGTIRILQEGSCAQARRAAPANNSEPCSTVVSRPDDRGAGRASAGHAHSGGEHRDDLVRARHAAEAKKQREQERHRQENHKNLRHLREIILQQSADAKCAHRGKSRFVADIEDEPDRDESRDAVEVGLQKITQDVAIEQSHEEFRNLICDLRFAGSAQLQRVRRVSYSKSQIANRQSQIPHDRA